MSREDTVVVRLTILEATMVHSLASWAIRNDGLEDCNGPVERRAAESGRDKIGQYVGGHWTRRSARRRPKKRAARDAV